MRNVFRTATGLINCLFLIASPILPKTKPINNRAKYGKAASIPVWPKLKPRTEDINFGPAVIKKNKPHKFPKCKIIVAINGIFVANFVYGGIFCKSET